MIFFLNQAKKDSVQNKVPLFMDEELQNLANRFDYEVTKIGI